MNVWQSAPHSVWATTHKSCWAWVDLFFKYFMCAWVDLFFKYFMCAMNVSFLSNLYSLTTCISESSILMTGALCIFLREQKCTHLILDLENLNLFSVAHLSILLMFICSCHYYVHMSGLRAYEKVIDVESTVDWRGQTFYNIIYFDGEVSNRDDAA